MSWDEGGHVHFLYSLHITIHISLKWQLSELMTSTRLSSYLNSKASMNASRFELTGGVLLALITSSANELNVIVNTIFFLQPFNELMHHRY